MKNENNQALNRNALLQAALTYAERGWPVLPLHTIIEGKCTCPKGSDCQHPGKHPRLFNGVNGATTDKGVINQWWTQWPDANVAIATGEQSFDVLDVDIKDDGKSTLKNLETEYGILPDTPCQKTGSGGGQYFFKYSGQLKNSVRFAAGLDSRSTGGYVVVPPSSHYSGGIYQWESEKSPFDLLPVDMPEWLIKLIGNSNNQKTNNSVEEEIAQGKRNDALFSVGCSMRAKGLHIEEIGPAVQKINERRCKPPLSQNEVEAIIKSVEKHEPGSIYGAEFSSNGKPEIDARNQDVQVVSKEVWNALQLANDPPWLFKRDDRLIHVMEDEGAHSLRDINEPRLRYFLSRHIAWFVKKGEDKIRVLPPNFVIEDMLAEPNPPLPRLIRLIESPIFSSNGILHSSPGYSESTSCYLSLANGLSIPDVSASPTSEEVLKARQVVQNLFCDFPFASESEGVMAFSLFILPFARELISGPVPIYLIEAPTQGTGKTLLASVAAFSALGREMPAISGSKNGEEFRKLITAILSRAPSLVLLDNITGTLDSSQLAAAITSLVWEDRILGKSETVRLPARCIWIITANNLLLSTDLARRSVRIRLDAKMDRPWNRDPSSFRHSNIFEWVRSNRGELIWAALTLIENWLSQGRPHPVGIKPIGGFEAYCDIIGGILHCAGIDGFLGSMEDFYDVSDKETEILRSLVAFWWQEFRDREVGVAQLYPLVDKYDIPLDLGNSGNDRGPKTRFGKFLGSLRDRQIGNYRVSAGGSKDNAQRYKLIQVAELPVNIQENSDEVPARVPSNITDVEESVSEQAGNEPVWKCNVDTEDITQAVEPIMRANRCSWMEALNMVQEQ